MHYSKIKSLEQTTSKKAVSRRLSHENSEKVWNELSLYKSMCEDFKKQVYVHALTMSYVVPEVHMIDCVQGLS